MDCGRWGPKGASRAGGYSGSHHLSEGGAAWTLLLSMGHSTGGPLETRPRCPVPAHPQGPLSSRRLWRVALGAWGGGNSADCSGPFALGCDGLGWPGRRVGFPRVALGVVPPDVMTRRPPLAQPGVVVPPCRRPHAMGPRAPEFCFGWPDSSGAERSSPLMQMRRSPASGDDGRSTGSGASAAGIVRAKTLHPSAGHGTLAGAYPADGGKMS